MDNKEKIKELFARIDEADQALMGLYIALNVDLMVLEFDVAKASDDNSEKTEDPVKAQLPKEFLQDMKMRVFELGRQSDIQRAAINELKTLI